METPPITPDSKYTPYTPLTLPSSSTRNTISLFEDLEDCEHDYSPRKTIESHLEDDSFGRLIKKAMEKAAPYLYQSLDPFCLLNEMIPDMNIANDTLELETLGNKLLIFIGLCSTEDHYSKFRDKENIELTLGLFYFLLRFLSNKTSFLDSQLYRFKDKEHKDKKNQISNLINIIKDLRQIFFPSVHYFYRPSNIVYNLEIAHKSFISIEKEKEYYFYQVIKNEENLEFIVTKSPGNSSLTINNQKELKDYFLTELGDNGSIEMIIQKDILLTVEDEPSPMESFLPDITEDAFWESGYGAGVGELLFRLFTICGVETYGTTYYWKEFLAEKKLLKDYIGNNCTVGSAIIVVQNRLAHEESFIDNDRVTKEQHYSEMLYHELIYICRTITKKIDHRLANVEKKEMLKEKSPFFAHLMAKLDEKIKDQGRKSSVILALKTLRDDLEKTPAQLLSEAQPQIEEIEQKLSDLPPINELPKEKKHLSVQFSLWRELYQLRRRPTLACRPFIKSLTPQVESKFPQYDFVQDLNLQLMETPGGYWILIFSSNYEVDHAIVIHKLPYATDCPYEILISSISSSYAGFEEHLIAQPHLILDLLYQKFGKNIQLHMFCCYKEKKSESSLINTLTAVPLKILETMLSAGYSAFQLTAQITNLLSPTGSKTAIPELADLPDHLQYIKNHLNKMVEESKNVTELTQWVQNHQKQFQKAPLAIKMAIPKEPIQEMVQVLSIFQEEILTIEDKISHQHNQATLGTFFCFANRMARFNLETDFEKMLAPFEDWEEEKYRKIEIFYHITKLLKTTQQAYLNDWQVIHHESFYLWNQLKVGQDWKDKYLSDQQLTESKKTHFYSIADHLKVFENLILQTAVPHNRECYVGSALTWDQFNSIIDKSENEDIYIVECTEWHYVTEEKDIKKILTKESFENLEKNSRKDHFILLYKTSSGLAAYHPFFGIYSPSSELTGQQIETFLKGLCEGKLLLIERLLQFKQTETISELKKTPSCHF